MSRRTPKKDPEQPPQSQSVADRWTELVAKKGFTPVATVFLENYGRLNITPTEAMLVIHLISFKWTRGDPFPSVTRLAKLMKCSDRYIRKMCANLESVDLIKRQGRDGTSNTYDLSGLFTKLEAIVIQEGLEATRRAQEVEAAVAKMRSQKVAAAAARLREAFRPDPVSPLVANAAEWLTADPPQSPVVQEVVGVDPQWQPPVVKRTTLQPLPRRVAKEVPSTLSPRVARAVNGEVEE